MVRVLGVPLDIAPARVVEELQRFLVLGNCTVEWSLLSMKRPSGVRARKSERTEADMTRVGPPVPVDSLGGGHGGGVNSSHGAKRFPTVASPRKRSRLGFRDCERPGCTETFKVVHKPGRHKQFCSTACRQLHHRDLRRKRKAEASGLGVRKGRIRADEVTNRAL